MSTVGLTKAMREALERVNQNAADITPAMRAKLHERWLVYFAGHCTLVSRRGHAALAAPRMTREQYDWLCYIESESDNAPSSMQMRLFDRGWIDRATAGLTRLTPAGRTALNNVRAAMPGQTSERERLADRLGSKFVSDDFLNQIAAQLRADEAEIAQLKDRVAAYEAQYDGIEQERIKFDRMEDEIAALRAENEALRTVTDSDVGDACRRAGMEPDYEEMNFMREVLQSFIRSKESRRE